MSQESAQFQTLMNQGHSAAWEQDWEKALNAYHQALQEIPNHPVALASAGLACFQLKRYEEALRYYQKCASLTPTIPCPVKKWAGFMNAPDY